MSVRADEASSTAVAYRQCDLIDCEIACLEQVCSVLHPKLPQYRDWRITQCRNKSGNECGTAEVLRFAKD